MEFCKKIGSEAGETCSAGVKEVLGSQGEGGGQVIRTSLALAAIHGIPVRLIEIRAKRSKPGLAAQHLAGVNLLRDVSEGSFTGNVISSKIVSFSPKPKQAATELKALNAVEGEPVAGPSYDANVGTAGSITLVTQITLPYLLFSGRARSFTLRLTGGSNVSMSPPIEHTQHVLLPLLKRMLPSMKFGMSLESRGYFPKGCGVVSLNLSDIDARGEAIPINLFRPKVDANADDNGEGEGVPTDKEVEVSVGGSSIGGIVWTVSGVVCSQGSDAEKSAVSECLRSLLETQMGEAMSLQGDTLGSCEIIIDEIRDGAGGGGDDTAGRGGGWKGKNKQKQKQGKRRRERKETAVSVCIKGTHVDNTDTDALCALYHCNVLSDMSDLSEAVAAIAAGAGGLQTSVTSVDSVDKATGNSNSNRDKGGKSNILLKLVQDVMFHYHSDAAVDEHTADQLIIYQAMAVKSMVSREVQKTGSSDSLRGLIYRITVAPPSQHTSLHLSTVVSILNEWSAVSGGEAERCYEIAVNNAECSDCRNIDFTII